MDTRTEYVIRNRVTRALMGAPGARQLEGVAYWRTRPKAVRALHKRLQSGAVSGQWDIIPLFQLED